MSSEKLVKSLKSFAEEISADYSLKSMYLFGSRAMKKRVRRDGDVNLPLVSDKFKGKRRLKRSPPLYLKRDLSYPVDFICLTPREFKKKKNEIGVIREAVRDGVKII